MTDTLSWFLSAEDETAVPTGILARIGATARRWRANARRRRALAQIDARSLRDAGIAPGAVAYELQQPPWRNLGNLGR